MITKRIIPCLDVRDGRVVKGVNFEGLQDVSSPVELGKYYSDNGADELVFYDITASSEGRKLFTEILTEVASTIFIPLTVGGGINTLEDFDRVLKCGADKVSVNSGAIRDPELIGRAAKRYGDQCVVLSVDVKRVDGRFTVFAKGGRENTGIDAIEWIRRGEANGAGEIVVNSIDTDGVKRGFDIVSGGTDNHSMLVDLRSKYPDLTGKVAEKALVAADLTVNKNMVPFDSRSAFQTSGIRLGTPAITTRGAKEDLMVKIAEFIERVLNAPEDEAVIAQVRSEVNAIMADYPIFAY